MNPKSLAKTINPAEKYFSKSGNIIANVVISSILLAICLPKLTFYLRKLVTGSDAEPGLIKNA